jgi:hypothetical protein
MEKITQFTPAFDKRHTDPSKNYGIGAMQCRMILKGEEGAVQFVFSTGIHLSKVVDEYEHKMRHLKPMGFDVGYHSPKPTYDGQKADDCDLLESGKCYYDGSSLRAQEWLEIFICKGSETIWEMLQEYYNELFVREGDK